MKPIAFMGKRWTDVTAKSLLVTLCLIFLIRPIQVNAETESLQFYVFSCPTCEGLEERMHVLEDTYPQGIIIFFDVAEDNNAKRFDKISDILGELLFMPLVGIFKDGSITAVCSGALSENDWQKSITEARAAGIPVYIAETENQMKIKAVIRDPQIIEKIENLFTESDIIVNDMDGFFPLLPIVIIAATMDAFNPCCVSVFIILLTFIFHDVGKKSVLKIGLAFTIALFVSYFMVGLGLSRIFPSVPQIKYITAAFSLIIGGLRIIDALGIKVKHIPSAFAGIISKQLESVSNPGTGFIAGIVTGFLMLPCSSAPYFIVLSLLSERALLIDGMLLLGLYNFIIIIPFLIITLLVHTLTRTTMDFKLWSLEKNKWINLLMGLGLIFLGLLNVVS